MRKWLRRLGQLGLLIAVVGTSLLSLTDWAINSFAPRRTFDIGQDPNVYFELGHDGWSPWNVDGASMVIFPRLPDGPLPNPNGVSVAMHLIADTWVTETDAAGLKGPTLISLPDHGAVQVYVPSSATNVQVATLSEQQDDFQLANNSLKFGPGDIFDPSKPKTGLTHSNDGMFTLEPYLDYTYQTLEGKPRTFHLIASYQLDFDLPAAFVGYDGIYSGISRLQWDPMLARTRLGLGATGDKQPEFTVGACQCGLQAVAPAPAANYHGDIIWEPSTAAKPVTYEVSTNSWVSDLVATSKTLWIPAILGVLLGIALPTFVARRGRHRLDSS